jgi:hypothetical protein
MSVLSRPQLNLQELAKTLGTFRHVLERVEGVWLDFFDERNEVLPPEVTQVHLRREAVVLDRQIEQAITLAFRDNSRQLARFRDIRLAPVSSRSLMDVQLLVDSYIIDLEQRRVELFRSRANSSLPVFVIQDSEHAETPTKTRIKPKSNLMGLFDQYDGCRLP